MLIRTILLGAAGVALGLSQDLNGPAKVMRIVREEVKPGRSISHERHEGSIARALSRSRGAAYQLGLASVTGAGESWFLTGYETFAALESPDAAGSQPNAEVDGLRLLDGDYLLSVRTLLAVYRADLSYLPEDFARSLPKARFLSVAALRVQPGREREFVEMGKAMVNAYAKAKDPWPFVFYQVTSGIPNLTFLALVAAPAMTYFDESIVRARSLRGAVGDDQLREINRQVSQNVVSSENLLFALRPAMSYVSPAFAARDQAFWSPGTSPPAPAGSIRTSPVKR